MSRKQKTRKYRLVLARPKPFDGWGLKLLFCSYQPNSQIFEGVFFKDSFIFAASFISCTLFLKAMKKLLVSICMLGSCLGLWSCIEVASTEAIPVPSQIFVTDSYALGENVVRIGGDLTNTQSTSFEEYGIRWYQQGSTTQLGQLALGSPKGLTKFESSISNLQRNQQYEVRPYLRRGEEVALGPAVQFRMAIGQNWNLFVKLQYTQGKPTGVAGAVSTGLVFLQNIDEKRTNSWRYGFFERSPGNFVVDWSNGGLLPIAGRYDPVFMSVRAPDPRDQPVSFFCGGYQDKANSPLGRVYMRDFWVNAFRFDGATWSAFDDQFLTSGNSRLVTFRISDTKAYILENSAQTGNMNQIIPFTSALSFPKASFIAPTDDKMLATGTSERGYVLVESERKRSGEFYEYNPNTDTWRKLRSFDGPDRLNGVLFGIRNKVYYGVGQSKTQPQGFRDIWEYNPNTDQWAYYTDYPGTGHTNLVTAHTYNFQAGENSEAVYIGMGYQVSRSSANAEFLYAGKDWWIFR
jgi:hypothetical protein